MEYLKELILNDEYNDDFFKVINLEAGTGKSVKTKEVLSTFKRNNKKGIYVVERNADAIEAEKIINKLADENIALTINTDVFNSRQFNKIKDELVNYNVLIISHEKYKVLSVNKRQREYFTKDRTILIIDEYLNMATNVLTINKDYIDTFETMLGHRALRELYAECVSEIEDYLLLDKKKNTFFNSKQDYKTICKKINKLKNLTQKTLTKEYVKSIKTTKNKILQQIEDLKQFYNQTCVCEGNIIYCTDRRYNYWLLNNNIILDATANITEAYKLNNIFHIYNQSKILNYKNWLFYVINANSNLSAKEKYVDFYEKINKIIIKKDIEKTLVIGNKFDEDNINATYKNHFGNITGSNKYKDLENCIIVHNPNIPYRTYVLEYLYYSNKKIDNRGNWNGYRDGAGDNMVYRFCNKKIERYRINYCVTQIYQAVKRVNRDNYKNTEVIIINNDEKIIDKILKQFKNCKSKDYSNIFTRTKTKMDIYNEERKENSQAVQFINLLYKIQKNELDDVKNLSTIKKNRKGEKVIIDNSFSKQKIREFMNINNKAQFTNNILNNADVAYYMHKHNISNKGQSIIFNV